MNHACIEFLLVRELIAGGSNNGGVEQERLEGWLLAQVETGETLPGLYPPNEETRRRYEAWKAEQNETS